MRLLCSIRSYPEGIASATKQTPHLWALWRDTPLWMQVFEKLWGTNELLSSFDSINCLPPSSATGVANDQTSWLHADQAPLRRGFFCIQVSLAAKPLAAECSPCLFLIKYSVPRQGVMIPCVCTENGIRVLLTGVHVHDIMLAPKPCCRHRGSLGQHPRSSVQ